jgi:two-component system response regulator AtoC
MAARAIHPSSRRRDLPIVTLNCATIPPELLESELFGHLKGAFAGAASDQAGVVESPLGREREVGDLVEEECAAVRAHPLRFLETGEARRLGDPKPTRFDVRIIAATNRPVVAEIRRGRFRQDL